MLLRPLLQDPAQPLSSMSFVVLLRALTPQLEECLFLKALVVDMRPTVSQRNTQALLRPCRSPLVLVLLALLILAVRSRCRALLPQDWQINLPKLSQLLDRR